MNGFRINVIEADSYNKALEQAAYLYGLTVDVEKIVTTSTIK